MTLDPIIKLPEGISAVPALATRRGVSRVPLVYMYGSELLYHVYCMLRTQTCHPPVTEACLYRLHSGHDVSACPNGANLNVFRDYPPYRSDTVVWVKNTADPSVPKVTCLWLVYKCNH